MITLSTYAVIICEWSNIIMRIIGKGIEYAVARMEAIGLTKIPSPCATDLTDVYLEHLSIKLLDEKRVKVSIAGLNQKTGHRFALERVFYSYGYGLTPIVEEEGATV